MDEISKPKLNKGFMVVVCVFSILCGIVAAFLCSNFLASTVCFILTTTAIIAYYFFKKKFDVDFIPVVLIFVGIIIVKGTYYINVNPSLQEIIENIEKNTTNINMIMCEDINKKSVCFHTLHYQYYVLEYNYIKIDEIRKNENFKVIMFLEGGSNKLRLMDEAVMNTYVLLNILKDYGNYMDGKNPREYSDPVTDREVREYKTNMYGYSEKVLSALKTIANYNSNARAENTTKVKSEGVKLTPSSEAAKLQTLKMNKNSKQIKPSKTMEKGLSDPNQLVLPGPVVLVVAVFTNTPTPFSSSTITPTITPTHTFSFTATVTPTKFLTPWSNPKKVY